MVRKNILVLSYVHEGGEWFATQSLIKQSKKLVNKLYFYLIGFTDGYKTDSRSFEKIVYVRSQPTKHPFKYFKKMLIGVWNIGKEISKLTMDIGKFDYILVTHYFMVFPIFLVRKLKNSRLIFFFHGTKSLPLNHLTWIKIGPIVISLLERLSLILSPVIIVPSLWAKKYVRSLINSFDKEKKIFIIPNEISPEFSKMFPQKSISYFRKTLKIDINKKIILYCGRIAPYKGLDNLLEAFSKFTQINKDVVLVIAYPQKSIDKALYRRLRGNIRDKGINSKVKFVANLKKPELTKLYKASDVLILASGLEMAPLVVIESSLQGTPFIATKVGNMENVLSKLDSNLILKNGSFSEILRKFEYFFALPQEKHRLLRKAAIGLAKQYLKTNPAKSFVQILDSPKT